MGNVALLENFTDKLRHAGCDEHYFDFSGRLPEYFTEFALAN